MSSDLELQREELVAKIQSIDAQFADHRNSFENIQAECRRNLYDPANRERLAEARREYNVWKGKANHAKRHAVAELAQVRAMIRDQNVAATEDTYHQRYWMLHRAITAHRQKVMDDGYAATGADLELWAILDDHS